MNESSTAIQAQPRKWWQRALLMVVMAVAFHLAASVLAIVAIVQLVLFVANGRPHERLSEFGRGLARYLAQIAVFVTFGSEDVPFPFGEWPATPI